MAYVKLTLELQPLELLWNYTVISTPHLGVRVIRFLDPLLGCANRHPCCETDQRARGMSACMPVT